MQTVTGFDITIPWPPTANNLHTVSRGRKIKSRAGRSYELDVMIAVIHAGQPRIVIPNGTILAVRLIAYPPDRRRRDLANIEKAAIDSLTKAGCWEDDSLIDRLIIDRANVVSGGLVEVIAECIDPIF